MIPPPTALLSHLSATMYKTVRAEAHTELIEKRSRFIAHVKSVKTEEEALGFLSEIRTEHSMATHNVFAYVLRDNNLSRFSDDGEPSKTAGPPVLVVIVREGLTNVIIVITRYFGGTLLGTGGLVRAYGGAAKLGVDSAGICTITNCGVFLCECDYGNWGKLSNILQKVSVLDTEFTDKVLVKFAVAEQQENIFLKELTEIFNGRLEPVRTGEMEMAL